MYKSKITKIGEMAREIFEFDDMLILFFDDAPEDLHDIAVLHDKRELNFDVEKGDKIIIDKNIYDVVDVGLKAKETLKTMGHCTLKFTDEKKVNLPGEIILSGKKPIAIEIGMKIEIKKSSF